jgi:hypothetical protein
LDFKNQAGEKTKKLDSFFVFFVEEKVDEKLCVLRGQVKAAAGLFNTAVIPGSLVGNPPDSLPQVFPFWLNRIIGHILSFG